MTPAVAVVVPTYRRPALLLRCLTALAAQRLPYALFEVIVVDDGRTPETFTVIETVRGRHPGFTVKLIDPPAHARGPAAARNAGWQSCEAPVIAFTDDDTIPARDWLTEGLRALTPEVAAVWGHVMVPLSPAPSDYELSIKRMEGAPFLTANCFVRRDALAAVGGFDERFARAWREDSDLYFALLRHGDPVRPALRAQVAHPVRPARFGISLAQQKNAFFDALLYKKHPQLYRGLIGAYPPLDYYAIVLAAMIALVAWATGATEVAGLAAVLWLALTIAFLAHRLRGTTVTPARFVEMLLTSIAIPWAAVFWRLAGAIRFRVPFA